MPAVTETYRASTRGVFKEPVQEVILRLNQKAILDGCVRTEDNFRFVISQVDENWIIVLLAFVDGEPKEYTETNTADGIEFPR